MSHLVNREVFPLFEGLPTLVTNVVPLLWKRTNCNLKAVLGFCGSSNFTLNGLKDKECVTCVDELHVPLQVAIDHKNLVAAWVRARSLPHLLVMLLDVLLEPQPSHQRKQKPVRYAQCW